MRLIEVEQAKEWLVQQMAETSSYGERAIFARMIGILYMMPEAMMPEAERREWTPCSKKLPPVDECVLLAFESRMAVGYMGTPDERGRQRWNTCGGNWYAPLDKQEDPPIAWMPLPAEYKSA